MRFELFSRAVAAAALALAAPAAAADAASAPKLRADALAFSAAPEIDALVLSPDGTRYAARTSEGGAPRILVAPARAGAERRLIALPPESTLEWVRWAGNARLLASLSAPTGARGGPERATRLVAIDLAGGAQRFIGLEPQGPDGDDVIHLDPAGKFVLLSVGSGGREPGVYRIDLASGVAAEVVAPRNGVRNWYADGSGAVRAGIGSKGERWWVVYRAQAHGEFARSRPRGGGADSDIETLLPVSGTDQGYAVAAAPDGHYAVHRYDFGKRQLGAAVWDDADVDLDDFDVSASGALRAVHYTADRPRVAWFDPAFEALQREIDRRLPGGVNRVTSISDDGRRMIVSAASSTDPGRYLLFDSDTGSMELLATPHAAIEGRTLSAMAPVRYRARDGLEIPGFLTLPAGRTASGLPLVVMPHGGPFVRDTWGYDPWVQFLASRGYAVLQPNYRGSTGHGRAFNEAGDGEWGRGMQDDVDDGVAWLAAQGTIDPKRVCIMGASYGGYAAMWAAARNPGAYRCAISFAGISDIEAQLEFDRPSFPSRRIFAGWRERIQGDKAFRLATISPLARVSDLKVPILIAHGSADTTVPFDQSVKLHEALTRLGRTHEFAPYAGEGHGLADPANGADFLERVGAFLARYNPS